MKKVFLSIIALSTMLSFGSFVQAASSTMQSDLSERLRVEKEGFIKDISTQNAEGLINTADLISGSGLSDKDLYAAVENRINEKHQDFLSNPKNDTVAKEINALMRALASIDPKAGDFIQKMDESTSRGIRERAVRLLPKLYWFGQRNALMQRTDFYEPGQNLMTYRLMNLIASDDPLMRRYGSEEINRRNGAEPIIYKKMAERLEKDRTVVNNSGAIAIDAYSWFCRILRDYDRQNSQPILSSIVNDPAINSKIKKYAR